MYIKRIKRIIKSRASFENVALKQDVLRYLFSNTFYIKETLQKSDSEINKNRVFYRSLLDSLNFYKSGFSSYSLASRSRSNCLITTRPRSVYKFCKLTRMQIKKFISKDLLPGVRPSSW